MTTIRVLHILHSMNRGGAENAIMNYYRHIDRSLIQFDFLLTEPNKCQFEDEILSLGGHIYRVPLLRMSSPFSYINAVNRFFKLHHEYQIVHSHTSSKSVFPLSIAKLNRIPVRIAHSHNTQSEKGIRGWIRNGFKLPLKKVASHLCACGIDAAKWLYGEKAISEGMVTIIPNVIECPQFDFNKSTRERIRKQLHFDDNTLVIGCVARFSPQKNLLFLIDLFHALHQKCSHAKLLLLGDGELRNIITERIQQYGLMDSVILTGVVPNVTDYEQAMDAFIMSSFHEGLPLSLIEAQISGLKCFVSNGITRESDKTGLVTFIPLEKGPEFWVPQILSQMPYERRGYLDDLKKAGYDAETSASILQQFYLDTLKHAQ